MDSRATVQLSKGSEPLLEIQGPRVANSVHLVFRELASLGVSVMHAQLRPRGESLLQRLQLTDPHGNPLDESRCRMVLRRVTAALRQADAHAHRGAFDGVPSLLPR